MTSFFRSKVAAPTTEERNADVQFRPPPQTTTTTTTAEATTTTAEATTTAASMVVLAAISQFFVGSAEVVRLLWLFALQDSYFQSALLSQLLFRLFLFLLLGWTFFQELAA